MSYKCSGLQYPSGSSESSSSPNKDCEHFGGEVYLVEANLRIRTKETALYSPEFQKVGILGSRIPDIILGKSGHYFGEIRTFLAETRNLI